MLQGKLLVTKAKEKSDISCVENFVKGVMNSSKYGPVRAVGNKRWK
jgi:hypothetical protein